MYMFSKTLIIKEKEMEWITNYNNIRIQFDKSIWAIFGP